ncbi:cytochrome P450 86A1-like [Solanum stenotomum]|uniref:cytochrome P450 86A1-like n=1 Tax=Solanum stenotomum TaxID=172797 RepID=UPI0020D03F0D|nr:cytochrome P450 86A1-like [Solanum stenotomum]
MAHIYILVVDGVEVGMWGTDGDYGGESNIRSRSFCTVTCHPKNLEHILHTKFHNYPKGPTWQNTFGDVLGNQGISCAKGEEWISLRKIVVPELTKSKLGPSLHRWVNPSIKNDLLPILDKASKHNISIDLQKLMICFGTDNIFGIALGKKLKTLLNPEDPIALAMDTIFKFAFRRFFYPNFLWKFMKFFSIGSEGNLKKSIQILNNTITEAQEERNNRHKDETFDDDLLWTFMKKVQVNEHILPSSAIMGTILDILLAGRDSVATSASWFFWLVMNNPRVEEKIVHEIITVLKKTRGEDMGGSKVTHSIESPCGEETQEWMKDPLTYEEVNSLVYLHATLLETLRLYPAVPKIVRYAICDDILPDGTYVPAGSDIILLLYSVGRMKSVWGEDYLKFKPERWLSADEKRIERHEDGYKFAAFNGGSRICIAKYLTYLEMKSVASAILLRYELSHAFDHQVTSKLSFTIAMKNGLKVNLKRRDLSDFDVIN